MSVSTDRLADAIRSALGSLMTGEKSITVTQWNGTKTITVTETKK